MFHKIIETVKEHPYATAIGVFMIGIVLIIMFRGGSSSAAASPTDNSAYYTAQAAAVSSGNALAAQQGQVQAYVANSNNELAAQQTSIAGATTIATLQSQTQMNADTLSAQVAQTIAGLQSQASTLASTLSAQVAEAQIGASTTQNANNNATAANITASNNATQLGIVQVLAPPKASISPFDAIVTQDYNDYLGRAPDASGLAYWSGELATGNLAPAQVIAEIKTTPEYLNSHSTSAGH